MMDAGTDAGSGSTDNGSGGSNAGNAGMGGGSAGTNGGSGGSNAGTGGMSGGSGGSSGGADSGTSGGSGGNSGGVDAGNSGGGGGMNGGGTDAGMSGGGGSGGGTDAGKSGGGGGAGGMDAGIVSEDASMPDAGKGGGGGHGGSSGSDGGQQAGPDGGAHITCSAEIGSQTCSQGDTVCGGSDIRLSCNDGHIYEWRRLLANQQCEVHCYDNFKELAPTCSYPTSMCGGTVQQPCQLDCGFPQFTVVAQDGGTGGGGMGGMGGMGGGGSGGGCLSNQVVGCDGHTCMDTVLLGNMQCDPLLDCPAFGFD
jgi:hypothetical protein